MEIRLTNIGKQFNREWIFRNLTCTFPSGSISAIAGRNGSGKSTLLQVIAGSLAATEGTVDFVDQETIITPDRHFRQLAIVAPYMELVEEFTLPEMIRFHFSFKTFLKGNNPKTLLDRLGFSSIQSKPIRNFSSGMKQRVKLALAFMSNVPLLLLDEPSMNLDHEGIEWYHRLLVDLRDCRTVVICSNLLQTEASPAEMIIRVEDYKIRGTR